MPVATNSAVLDLDSLSQWCIDILHKLKRSTFLTNYQITMNSISLGVSLGILNVQGWEESFIDEGAYYYKWMLVDSFL